MGGAILTLKVRIKSGGSVSLDFVDGINDTDEMLGFGTAVSFSK